LIAAAIARPTPVLPEVGSTNPPGRSRLPLGSLIIGSPIRPDRPARVHVLQLGDDRGVRPAVIRRSRTNGVLPISSRIVGTAATAGQVIGAPPLRQAQEIVPLRRPIRLVR
jgi:hypothetical protein